VFWEEQEGKVKFTSPGQDGMMSAWQDRLTTGRHYMT